MHRTDEYSKKGIKMKFRADLAGDDGDKTVWMVINTETDSVIANGIGSPNVAAVIAALLTEHSTNSFLRSIVKEIVDNTADEVDSE